MEFISQLDTVELSDVRESMDSASVRMDNSVTIFTNQIGNVINNGFGDVGSTVRSVLENVNDNLERITGIYSDAELMIKLLLAYYESSIIESEDQLADQIRTEEV